MASNSNSNSDPIGKIIAAIGELQVNAEKAQAEREKVQPELKRIRAERDEAQGELESVRIERDAARAECDQLRNDHGILKEYASNVTNSAVKYRKACRYHYNEKLKYIQEVEKLVKMRRKLLSVLQQKSVVEDAIPAIPSTTAAPVVTTTTVATVATTTTTTNTATGVSTFTVARNNKPISSTSAMRSIGLSRKKKKKKISSTPPVAAPFPAKSVSVIFGSVDCPEQTRPEQQ